MLQHPIGSLSNLKKLNGSLHNKRSLCNQQLHFYILEYKSNINENINEKDNGVNRGYSYAGLKKKDTQQIHLLLLGGKC